MNNEPVAWMDDLSFFTEQPDDMDGVIPLYTHPVKEDEGKVCARCGAIAYDPVILQIAKEQLTEDEIEKVRIAIMNTAHWCADENMPEAYNAVKLCCSEVLAILRKAQE